MMKSIGDYQIGLQRRHILKNHFAWEEFIFMRIVWVVVHFAKVEGEYLYLQEF